MLRLSFPILFLIVFSFHSNFQLLNANSVYTSVSMKSGEPPKIVTQTDSSPGSGMPFSMQGYGGGGGLGKSLPLPLIGAGGGAGGGGSSYGVEEEDEDCDQDETSSYDGPSEDSDQDEPDLTTRRGGGPSIPSGKDSLPPQAPPPDRNNYSSEKEDDPGFNSASPETKRPYSTPQPPPPPPPAAKPPCPYPSNPIVANKNVSPDPPRSNYLPPDSGETEAPKEQEPEPETPMPVPPPTSPNRGCSCNQNKSELPKGGSSDVLSNSAPESSYGSPPTSSGTSPDKNEDNLGTNSITDTSFESKASYGFQQTAWVCVHALLLLLIPITWL